LVTFPRSFQGCCNVELLPAALQNHKWKPCSQVYVMSTSAVYAWALHCRYSWFPWTKETLYFTFDVVSDVMLRVIKVAYIRDFNLIHGIIRCEQKSETRIFSKLKKHFIYSGLKTIICKNDWLKLVEYFYQYHLRRNFGILRILNINRNNPPELTNILLNIDCCDRPWYTML
jgi:hypothetical protein